MKELILLSDLEDGKLFLLLQFLAMKFAWSHQL